MKSVFQIVKIGVALCSTGSVFGQNKLYVFAEEADHSDAFTNNCVIDDFQFGYRYTYNIGEYDISTTQAYVAIDYRQGYNDDPTFGCGGPCGAFGWFCDPNNNFPTENNSLDFYQNLNPFDVVEISHTGPSNPTCEEVLDYAADCLPLNYVAVYVPETTQPTDNARCSEDLIFPSNGGPHTFSQINWQYLNNSNQWVNLPNTLYRQRYPLDVSIEDIFGANYNSFFSGSLRLRYRVSVGFISTVYTSGTYTFTVTPCTPDITSVNASAASCSYNNDGSFTINFERALESGERIDFYLHKGSPTGPVFNQLLQSFSGTSYTWPDPLEPDNYYLDYQSNPSGSVVSYGPIAIMAPSPVTFSATWTDVDCYGDNTGSIAVTANGGVGNYEYRLGTGTWQPFSNANTHTIQNLIAGNYELRVRDANQCTEQQ